MGGRNAFSFMAGVFGKEEPLNRNIFEARRPVEPGHSLEPDWTCIWLRINKKQRLRHW